MADELTPAEKAAEIIEKSPEGEETEQTPETTTEQPDGDKQGETSDKDAEVTGRLYAGTFKTPDMLEKSVNELSANLGMSRLEQRTLRSAIAEAKESNDFSEVEEIYKEMQAKHTKSRQGIDGTTPGKESEVVQPDKEYTPLTQDQRVPYLISQVQKRLLRDPVVDKFRSKGIEIPTAEIGTPEWDEQMLELADTSPGLHALLDRKVVALAREEVSWLEQYENVAAGTKTARITAEDEGRKYLAQINTDLSIGLTPDDIAETIANALKSKESYDTQLGIQTPKRDAVKLYFNNNVLHGKVKSMLDKARNDGAFAQSKGLQKMRDEAQQTVGKTKLSVDVDRRGKDAPKFDTHRGAEAATSEQRARRIQEILANSQDKE